MWERIKTWIQTYLTSDSASEANKLVFKTREHHMASIVKLKLEDEGIRVFMINKMDSAYNNFGEIELYVNQDDVMRALHIIEKTE